MRRDYLLVTGLALMFFFPFLGGLHLFDPEEVCFAECAREMLVTGDWVRPQLDFQPYREMPPLFFWAQAISMQVFGVGEFAARLPNALCGLATLLLVYRLGLRLHDRMFAWLWVFAWLGSFLPHFYFRSGIIDPWFNLLIFCGLYGFVEFRWQFLTRRNLTGFWKKYRWLIWGGGSLGLAIMTKGPIAYLIIMLVLGLYWARYRFKGNGYAKHLLLFSASSMAVAVVWFGLEITLHGTGFAWQFAVHQIQNIFHPPATAQIGFWGAQAIVLMLGCFPVSLLALPNLWGDRQSEDELLESDTLASCQRSDLATWMQLLFWVALLLFSVAPTNIAHYASLCYFPLTYLGTLTIWRAIRWDVRPKIVALLLPTLGVLLGLAVMAIPYLGQHQEYLKIFFADKPFVLAALNAEVHWEWWHSFPGFLLAATSLVGWYFWTKHRPWLTAQAVFAGGAVFTKLSMLFIVCNIEQYTQRAAVEFCKNKCGEKCTVQPIGFATYAHLFYACKMPDTPVAKEYFVAKITDCDTLIAMPGCRELYRKNGFVFFERMPAVNSSRKGQ